MAEHVFVYGSLKRGFKNFRLLEGAKFVGDAITAKAEFRMGNVGSYPEITRDDSQTAGFIAGELFLCDEPTLAELDRFEGNGQFYQREPVPMRVGEPKIGRQLTAWVYLWIKPPCPNVEPSRYENTQPIYEWSIAE